MGKAMSKPEIKRVCYPNGNILSINHILNGKRHREDGPAYIVYYPNGNILYNVYYLNGMCHRDCGPAWIKYNVSGEIIGESYYLRAYHLTREEWYRALNTEQRISLLYGKGNEPP
jgi:antitoxin component YwqK of YwqJK toxin-antitoxin module